VKTLFESIKTKFDGDAVAAAVNGLWDVAPEDTDYPFVNFQIIIALPDDTFNTRCKEIRFQFSIFSDSPSKEEVCDIFDLLAACFDYCILVVDGYDFIEMRQTNSNLMPKEEGNPWQYIVEYKILLEKT
jgi:hypothetical protein